ncbi:MAG TPA: PA2779 family protein [Terriglobia bacterium]|nr:PA2779 family protein [Terriglobia bacterium]
MKPISKRAMAGLLAALMVLTAAPIWAAQSDHVVPNYEINRKVAKAAQVRQQNLQTVQQFLASPEAQKALKKGKVDYTKVEKAIPTLSDQELAQLAVRANKVQNDFAAGALTNQQLTYIVIAIGTAVVVILIAKG